MAKAKAKLILYKSKPNKDGTFPIVLRITKDRARRYIFTSYTVTEEQWNEESSQVQKHPNSTRLNNLLSKKVTEAEDVIIDMDRDKESLNAFQLQKKIRGGIGRSVYELSKEYLLSKKAADKYNQYVADGPKFKNFRTFLETNKIGREIETIDENQQSIKVWDLDVRAINVALLKKYKLFLQTHFHHSENTIYNNLCVLRIIYNKAIEDKLIDSREYPFGRGKERISLKPGESQKIGLDIDELKAFINLDISENNEALLKELKRDVKYVKDISKSLSDLRLARQAFLYSFAFAGMRCADIVMARWSDFKNGRYYYTIGKNKKPVNVPIPEAAQIILDALSHRREEGNEFVFRFLDGIDICNKELLFTKIRTANKKLNDGLKIIGKVAGIVKEISMHIARHTFGNLAKGKIPVEVLQLLYRHSHLSTTINYQTNFIQEQTDVGLLEIANLAIGSKVFQLKIEA